MRARLLPATGACCAALGLALAGCGGGDGGDVDFGTRPAARSPEPDPCEFEPVGTVADGVNDGQGGSTPGTDPCHSPGD